MIHIIFFEHGHAFLAFTDEADMADAYVQYAQLCGYGIELEVL